MSIVKKTILLSAAIGIVASVAFGGADAPSPESKAIKARQAKMTLYSFNMGILGAMAKGERDFNADAAGLAAGNLAAISATWMPDAWMAGTSNFDMEGTAALPRLWTDNPAEVGAKARDLTDASAMMVSMVATLEGLRGSIGTVGKTCGACHKLYRASAN